MGYKPLFLVMAVVQAFFAKVALLDPLKVKNYNTRIGTIWARLPIGFYRTIGFICTVAALWFFYLFLHPPSD